MNLTEQQYLGDKATSPACTKQPGYVCWRKPQSFLFAQKEKITLIPYLGIFGHARRQGNHQIALYEDEMSEIMSELIK